MKFVLIGFCLIAAFLTTPESVQSAETQTHKGNAPVEGWMGVKYYAEAKLYPEAALTAVKELSGDYSDRQYAMWKWWETIFGERTDYMEMSHRFGETLFVIYDQSSGKNRQIIAEIFGRPHFNVTRPAKELRAEIESERAGPIKKE